jgi:hypothetical protein
MRRYSKWKNSRGPTLCTAACIRIATLHTIADRSHMSILLASTCHSRGKSPLPSRASQQHEDRQVSRLPSQGRHDTRLLQNQRLHEPPEFATEGWKISGVIRKNLADLDANNGVLLALPEGSERNAPDCIFEELQLENNDLLAWLQKHLCDRGRHQPSNLGPYRTTPFCSFTFSGKQGRLAARNVKKDTAVQGESSTKCKIARLCVCVQNVEMFIHSPTLGRVLFSRAGRDNSKIVEINAQDGSGLDNNKCNSVISGRIAGEIDNSSPYIARQCSCRTCPACM